MFAGEKHTSVIGSFAPDFYRATNVIAFDPVYDENHKPVIEKYFIALLHGFRDIFVRYGNHRFVA